MAVLLGAALVFLKFPKRDEERRLLASYQAEDAVPVPDDRSSTSDSAPAGAEAGAGGP